MANLCIQSLHPVTLSVPRDTKRKKEPIPRT